MRGEGGDLLAYSEAASRLAPSAWSNTGGFLELRHKQSKNLAAPPNAKSYLSATRSGSPTDKHLSERVGIIVRLNSKTASIAVTDSEGRWRVSYGLLVCYAKSSSSN